MSQILVPKTATRGAVKDATQRIMELFKKLIETGNADYGEQIEAIVDTIDVPWAGVFTTPGGEPGQFFFLPKRLREAVKDMTPGQMKRYIINVLEVKDPKNVIISHGLKSLG